MGNSLSKVVITECGRYNSWFQSLPGGLIKLANVTALPRRTLFMFTSHPFFFLCGDIESREKTVPSWNCSQQAQWIVLTNCVKVSGKRHCCWVYQITFCAALITTSWVPWSSITLESRQTPPQPISPKLANSHQKQSRWINSTSMSTRENMWFWFGPELTL